MTEEEKILKEFVEQLVEQQVDMPSEFRELVNEHFWELVD